MLMFTRSYRVIVSALSQGVQFSSWEHVVCWRQYVSVPLATHQGCFMPCAMLHHTHCRHVHSVASC